jgi:hypothetical protein
MQISNLTNQCSLFTTVRYIFWDQWGWPPMNGEPCAHDIWWTLDFASAFLSPRVSSRAELVPSHGASRRRLGDYSQSPASRDETFAGGFYYIPGVLCQCPRSQLVLSAVHYENIECFLNSWCLKENILKAKYKLFNTRREFMTLLNCNGLSAC